MSSAGATEKTCRVSRDRLSRKERKSTWRRWSGGLDPSTGNPRTTGDMDVIVADLWKVAGLGVRESPPVRFAYEALAWSTHVDMWEACWEVVQRVDRPNFGICLDTFNLAGRVYTDPAVRGGKVVNADASLKASLALLMCGRFFIYRLWMRRGWRGRWSRVMNRMFQDSRVECRGRGMRGFLRLRRIVDGYLPILEVARAFFDFGFEGWVSLELFSETTADPNPNTPAEHARRGAQSWRKLVRYLGLKVDDTGANASCMYVDKYV
ncbi:hypothetical protein EMCG_08625 [[Emmonsia] crescens]|uniref:Xylose isomerase-like TIM barrel domain-containing protein n=1 Tax=[Emmonsia] crescens TaxID=73230 RepID=A0A0G2I4L2_9EURO|nr:hypothetical protein EMCG_08625 [Emmonsia crescens UAMH 3008]